jgi:thioredoxin 1
MSTSTRIPATSDAAFAGEVLASELPVLVDFTAAWCPPCRMVTPVLEQLAADEAHRLRIVTLDVDAHPETARAYAVMSMPTLALFRDGRVVATVVGAQSRTAILKRFEPYLV